jgi:hypothetical protein
VGELPVDPVCNPKASYCRVSVTVSEELVSALVEPK